MKFSKVLALSAMFSLVMSSAAWAHPSSNGYTETVRTVSNGYDTSQTEVHVTTRTHYEHDNYGHHHRKWNHRRHHRHNRHHSPSHHYEKHVTVYQSPRPVYYNQQYSAPAPQYYSNHDPVSRTLVGGAFGAAAGAAIGAVVGDPGGGAAIGAVLGGFSGASRSLFGHGLLW